MMKRHPNKLTELDDVARAASSISSGSPGDVLRRLARAAVGSGFDCCIVELAGPGDEAEIAVVAHRDPAAEARLRMAAPVGAGDGPHKRRGCRCAWHTALRDAGVAEITVHPLQVQGRTIGSVSLAAAGDGDGADVVALAVRIIAAVSAVAENYRLARQTLRIGEVLQQALLPTSMPAEDGYTFKAFYMPAGEEQLVGGDWYDAFRLPDGRVALSVGDVAGHGLPAAVTMGEVRQAFRIAALAEREPDAVLSLADRLLLLRDDAVTVTAIFAIYDPRERLFRYATAGHPPPVLATRAATFVLPHDGLPLGIQTGCERRCWDFTLAPGSLVVLYTDGLIENNRDIVYGENRLLESVNDAECHASENAAEFINRHVLGDRRASDDVAIVTLRVADRLSDDLRLRYSATPMAAGLMRAQLRRFVAEHGIAEETGFSLIMAIGEAMSNVIEHAYPPNCGTVDIHVWRDGSTIRASVADGGQWRAPRQDGKGRGIEIIKAVTSHMSVQLSQSGTTVSVQIAEG
jgi:serine phosphatase RsbU (regulator of sigma subunit)/anti-sigma regulatory factor (Ser/Thr protein kinase)